MNALFELYRAFFRISVLAQLQYRASGAIWMIGSILEPVVFLVVWSTVAKEQGGSVQGFDARDFAAYYMVLLVVNHLTFSWVMHDFQFRVQFGHLSFDLMRPVHPIHADISDNLAYKLVMLFVMLPALVVLYFAFDPRLTSDPVSLVLFVPALAGGFFTRFLFEWALALAAFWTTRVTALNQIYFSLLMFLAGRVAPIALLPEALRALASHLPFYYMVGFPVDVALGRVPVREVVEGLGMQALWLALAAGTVALVWRRAVARFSAVGS